MPNDVIYLDYNASTPCDPRVVEAMQPFFGSIFANPSSRNHRPGRDAFSALEKARTSVADRAPRSLATVPRDSSSAVKALRPGRWFRLDGLAKTVPKKGCIASTTLGSHGVEAL